MDVREAAEGVKFKDLERKNSRIINSSETWGDINNNSVVLIKMRL